MRIAFVHPFMITPGGSEYITKWLCDQLASDGHQVTLFTMGYDETIFGSPNGKFAVLNLLPQRLTTVSARTAIRSCVFAAKRLAKDAPHFDCIIAHIFPATLWCHWARNFQPYFPPVIWLCQEPPRFLHWRMLDFNYRQRFPVRPIRLFIDCLHESRRLILGRLPAYLLRSLDIMAVSRLTGIIANSRFTAETVQRVYRRSALVCHLGVPVNHSFEFGERVIHSDQAELLYVGRLSKHKNIDMLIRGFEAASLPPQWHLRLIGLPDKKWQRALYQLVDRLRLKDRVIFSGMIPSYDHIMDAYQKAYAVVYLPLDEPFGLVPLEAGVNGRCVVVSDHGGPAELVTNGYDGLTVNPLSVPAIAAALSKIASSYDTAMRMGVNWRNKVLNNYTVKHFADRFLQLLNALVTQSATVHTLQ
ncbi:MAG: glycosyltransferase family 4 protein [Armatimonadetes bacterium]|nr:glycosyltransferase family 4 protein [Armatimonadota bacterium]MDW8120696.1 glycosyltransferase family 4 protein [Armatimonadota bacterium]